MVESSTAYIDKVHQLRIHLLIGIANVKLPTINKSIHAIADWKSCLETKHTHVISSITYTHTEMFLSTWHT